MVLGKGFFIILGERNFIDVKNFMFETHLVIFMGNIHAVLNRKKRYQHAQCVHAMRDD